MCLVPLPHSACLSTCATDVCGVAHPSPTPSLNIHRYSRLQFWFESLHFLFVLISGLQVEKGTLKRYGTAAYSHTIGELVDDLVIGQGLRRAEIRRKLQGKTHSQKKSWLIKEGNKYREGTVSFPAPYCGNMANAKKVPLPPPPSTCTMYL